MSLVTPVRVGLVVLVHLRIDDQASEVVDTLASDEGSAPVPLGSIASGACGQKGLRSVGTLVLKAFGTALRSLPSGGLSSVRTVGVYQVLGCLNKGSRRG